MPCSGDRGAESGTGPEGDGILHPGGLVRIYKRNGKDLSPFRMLEVTCGCQPRRSPLDSRAAQYRTINYLD